MSYTDKFIEKGRFTEDDMWLRDQLIMECVMGSQAYGVANKQSDVDIVGIVMSPHVELFPQNYNFVRGFDNPPMFTNKEYKDGGKIILDNGIDCEGEWHTLCDFFELAGLKGSPNLLEILFVRRPLVTFADDKGITWKLRDNRGLFLSQKTFMALKGYTFQQLMRVKRGVERWKKEGKCDNSRRKKYYEQHGYDIKQMYHPLRLLDNMHQILTENDIDLMRNKDECLSMRNGTWGTFNDAEKYILDKMKKLESLILQSNKLSLLPQKQSLKNLLLECIEDWYGSVDSMQTQTEYVSAKMVMESLKRIEERL